MAEIRLVETAGRLARPGQVPAGGALGVQVLRMFAPTRAVLTFDRLYSPDGHPVLLAVDIEDGDRSASGWAGPGELEPTAEGGALLIDDTALARLHLASRCFELSGGRGPLVRGVGLLEGARWYISAFSARGRDSTSLAPVLDLARDMLGDWDRLATDDVDETDVVDWLREAGADSITVKAVSEELTELFRFFSGLEPAPTIPGSAYLFEPTSAGTPLRSGAGATTRLVDGDHAVDVEAVTGRGQARVRLEAGSAPALVWLFVGGEPIGRDEPTAAVLATHDWSTVTTTWSPPDAVRRVEVVPVGGSGLDDVEELLELQHSETSRWWATAARGKPWPDDATDLRRIAQLHLGLSNISAAGQAFALGRAVDRHCHAAAAALPWSPFSLPPGEALWARCGE